MVCRREFGVCWTEGRAGEDSGLPHRTWGDRSGAVAGGRGTGSGGGGAGGSQRGEAAGRVRGDAGGDGFQWQRATTRAAAEFAGVHDSECVCAVVRVAADAEREIGSASAAGTGEERWGGPVRGAPQ